MVVYAHTTRSEPNLSARQNSVSQLQHVFLKNYGKQVLKLKLNLNMLANIEMYCRDT